MDSPTYSPDDTLRYSPRYSPTSPRYSSDDYSSRYYERKLQELRLSRRKRASEDSIYKAKKTRSNEGKAAAEDYRVQSEHEAEYVPSYDHNYSPEATSIRKSHDGVAKEATPDHHHKSKGSDDEISNSRAGMWKSPEADDGAGVLRSQYSIEQPDLNPIKEREHAQPLIRAAWAGNFTVRGKVTATFQGLNCCLSTKACREARLAAEQLPPSIKWEKLPKWRVWPKEFGQRGLTDGDIAVFFFPSLAKHETVYDSLLFDLIRDDLALRTTVMGLDLLLFTSVDLPPPSTRFQGKLYLWGVFKGNHPRL